MKTYKQTVPQYSLVKDFDAAIKKAKITSSKEAVEYFKSIWEEIDIVESCYLLLINRANNTIGYKRLSVGGISESIIDTTILMKYAIESLASGFIILHNHPSGNLQPSDADIRFTHNIKKIADIHKINFLDSIIVSPDFGYKSLADEGLLN